MAENPNRQRRTTLRGAKLPQIPLDDALAIVRGLHELAGPVSKGVLAQHLRTTTSSSPFKTKLAAASYYGLIEVENGLYRLSKRGETILSDDGQAMEQARREAVMGTNFGPIIKTLSTREANEAVIAARLQQEYGAPTNAAPRIAKVLVETARQGRLLTGDDHFDARAIEAAAGVLRAPEDRTGERQRQVEARPKRPEEAEGTRPPAKQPARREEREMMSKPPFAATIRVEVKIDATHLSPSEIADVIRALQTTAGETAWS